MPTALITGASRGLGAAIARALAPGHRLILCGRDAQLLTAVAQETCVHETGAQETGAQEIGAVRTIAVDLTDHDALAAAVTGIGSLDVLVHCAGLASRLRPVGETTAEEWQQLFDINVTAPAELTRLLLPALRAAGGHVVFVNSGAGMNVRAGWTPYAASKFALRALADGLRAEEPGLRVTSIFPGRIDTDMQRGIVAREGAIYDPARYLSPDTVAAAVAQAIATPPDAHPTDIVLRPR